MSHRKSKLFTKRLYTVLTHLTPKDKSDNGNVKFHSPPKNPKWLNFENNEIKGII